MLQSSRGTERLRAFLVMAATVGVIAFNWLAATGRVNGVSPDVISAKYPTPITPAGYAFSIWSLIYLGLIAFSIYQLLPASVDKFRRIRSPYILSCALNCAWIYFWHSEQIAICLAIIVALAIVLFVINYQLPEHSSLAEYWAVKATFGLYFGWVTAATFVNYAVLQEYLNLEMSPSAETALAVVLILTAATMAVVMRFKFLNYIYPIAVAWALTAIAVRQSGQTLIVTAAAVGVIACLIASASFVMRLNSSISE